MCGCGELHTNILYNTASAICHHGEFTHELNCDKEQIYLKHLCYILWTTVKNILFFIESKKMDFGRKHIYIWNYIYIYIYASCRNWRQTMMDTLISNFYCVGFRNNQNPCFNFLASCPMYLFVPHQPTHTPLPNTQKDFRPFGDLEQSEGRETPKRIHLLNWWLLKQEKLHNNWILYFCCCSKQPVHVL